MILIQKPAMAPPRLTLGAGLTQDNSLAFDADPQAYLQGQKKFQFDSAIYGHRSVKRVLESVQHHKCCYCEGHFTGHAPGDVEHYRPKNGVQQNKGSAVQHPGYYWLAYSWQNLYFSCPDCNRTAKRRFFPLADASQRARGHADDVAYERPLILDPGGPDDPRDHIRFHQEVPLGITPRGQATVKFIRLDREALNERRRTRLSELQRLKEVIEVLHTDAKPAAQTLAAKAATEPAAAVLPASVFSAMAQDLLNT
jgi:hypothetical protein